MKNLFLNLIAFCIFSLDFITFSSGTAYKIRKWYKHDSSCFTEGLAFHHEQSIMYESCGGYSNSKLQYGPLSTTESKVFQVTSVPGVFAEGLTFLPNHSALVLLTWQHQLGYIYGTNLTLMSTWYFQGEGWGLTLGSDNILYMSNGSSYITRIDPVTMKTLYPALYVHDSNLNPVFRINELEWIRGEIWANIWYTNLLARISPSTGYVLGYVELSGILNATYYDYSYLSSMGLPYPDSLNGIAYDELSNLLWVTGKNWPFIFEISVGEIGSGVAETNSTSTTSQVKVTQVVDVVTLNDSSSGSRAGFFIILALVVAFVGLPLCAYIAYSLYQKYRSTLQGTLVPATEFGVLH